MIKPKYTCEQETVRLNYTVRNHENIFIREGSIVGSFPTEMTYTEIIDALSGIAWDKEKQADTNWHGNIIENE